VAAHDRLADDVPDALITLRAASERGSSHPRRHGELGTSDRAHALSWAGVGSSPLAASQR
jgi:hypothetical protein